MARDYKAEFEDLKRIAKKRGESVKTGWNNKSWRGMNHEAAKVIGVKCPPKTHLLAKSENTYAKKSQTLRHEMVEEPIMKKLRKTQPHLTGQQRYKVAHMVAGRLQNKGNHVV